MDISANLGDDINIVTRENDLILRVLGALELDTLGDGDGTNDLLTDEVADLESLTLLSNGDGEVIVDELHLVEEALGDTNEHVADVSDDGADSSEVSTVAEPHLSADGLALVDLLELDLQVVEVLGKRAAGTGDSNGTTSKLDLDCKDDREERWNVMSSLQNPSSVT